MEFVGDARDLGLQSQCRVRKWPAVGLTAVAIIEVSSIIRNMAAMRKIERAASSMPVTHCAPCLAAAEPSREESLKRRCETSVTDGLGEGSFPSFLEEEALASTSLHVADCAVEFMVEDMGLLGVSLQRSGVFCCSVEVEAKSEDGIVNQVPS